MGERDKADAKVEHVKTLLSSKMEDRMKREEHIRKAISGMERKLIIIEKKMAEQPSSSIGGGSITIAPLPVSASNTSSLDAGFSMSNENYDKINEKNDQLTKDVTHLQKALKELKNHYHHDIDHMKKEIANKAEKELLLDN